MLAVVRSTSTLHILLRFSLSLLFDARDFAFVAQHRSILGSIPRADGPKLFYDPFAPLLIPRGTLNESV